MDRRHFLQAAALITGSFATSAVAKFAQAGATSDIAQTTTLFTAQQRQAIAAMAEIVIPRTDTPGAIDAGVPHFIELMVEHWLQEQERVTFLQGMAELELSSQQQFGQAYFQLNQDQQLELLEALETEAEQSPWYDFANVERQYIEDAPFICQLKELTIFGFYSSEVGATQVLRHDPMPMMFDGELNLADDDSSWSTIRIM